MTGAFGAANRVTLLRGGLLALLVGFGVAVLAGDTETGTAWPFVLALIALLLDGVDGAVARRTGMCSDFGARFDMELDAAFALVLAILVLAYDRAGLWVLLLGVPRCAFLVAARWLPALRAPAESAAAGDLRGAGRHAGGFAVPLGGAAVAGARLRGRRGAAVWIIRGRCTGAAA